MSKYNDLINNGGSYAEAHRRMQELAIDLKQEFRLEEVFNEVIFGEEIAMTPAAQLLLVVPLVEAFVRHESLRESGIQDTGFDVDEGTIRQSLKKLVHEAKVNSARADIYPDELYLEDGNAKKWPMRASFSITKSLFENFCNIPPFCGEKDKSK